MSTLYKLWLLNFNIKTDLPIKMRICNNLKQCHVIHLKFGVTFFTLFNKLVLDANSGFCSTIKENLLLHFRKFLVFVIVCYCYCYSLPYFNNTVCLTKKHHS